MHPPPIYKEVNSLMSRVNSTSNRAKLLQLRNEALRLQQSNNAYTKSLVNYVNAALTARGGASNNTKITPRAMFKRFDSAMGRAIAGTVDGLNTKDFDLLIWARGQLERYASNPSLALDMNPDPWKATYISIEQKWTKDRARREERTRKVLAILSGFIKNAENRGAMTADDRSGMRWAINTLSKVFINHDIYNTPPPQKKSSPPKRNNSIPVKQANKFVEALRGASHVVPTNTNSTALLNWVIAAIQPGAFPDPSIATLMSVGQRWAENRARERDRALKALALLDRISHNAGDTLAPSHQAALHSVKETLSDIFLSNNPRKRKI